MKVVTARSAIECGTFCLRNTGCKSYNYRKQKRECDLIGDTVEMAGTVVAMEKGYRIYERTEASGKFVTVNHLNIA